MSHQGGYFTVRGTLAAAAPPDLVYDIITDYANNSRVFRNVSESTLSTSADGQQLQLLQVCRWRFLAFSGTFNVLLAISEQRPSHGLSFKLIESGFMQDFEGVWRVEEAGSGGGPATGTTGSSCVVRHQLSIRPPVDLPPLVSTYASPIFVNQVRQVLEDLDAAIAARVAAARGDGDGSGSAAAASEAAVHVENN